ncbi:MAG: phosphotransferase [Bacteriovoracaceae bacterium]|nr:phosphotransferase [Bacteriovoracaceae bacterium]
MNLETQIKTEKILVDSLFQNSISAGKVGPFDKWKIQRLTGDASSRRYYRVDCTEKQFVVCLQQPLEGGGRDSFVDMQSLLTREQIRVPHIYDVDLERGYLLEEDLGDQTLLGFLSKLRSPREELEAYEGALRELIKIHSIKKDNYLDSSFASLFFDKEKLMSEVAFTVKQLIEGLFSQALSEEKKKVLETTFEGICQTLASQKMVVTHRDYHSRNIMMKNSELIVIDFQDARMGIPQYDLVSLLEDCYYKISRQNKHALKKMYWEEFLKDKEYQSSFEEFSILYDKMAIQRIFKALGSFAYIYRLRGDIRYLKYIGYAFEKLRDILFRYKEFNQLRVVLSEVYYEY